MRELSRRREYCAGVDFDRHRARELEPAQAFERQWNFVVLDEAIDVLKQYVSKVDYKFFIMHRLYGTSIAELAKDSGLPAGTVRSKLSRTMQRFEQLVDDRGYLDLMFQGD